MTGPSTELAEERALGYLEALGVAVDAEVRRRVVSLVAAEAEAGQSGLVGRVLDRLPEVFALPPVEIPPQTPPLHRGSVGYQS